jgi:hypothetical protein
VTDCSDDDADFGQDLVDLPFDDQRVILIRTEAGRTWAIGNPVEDDAGLTLEFAELP